MTVPPREENFAHMLKFTFCPTFTFKSFIFFVTIVDILVYIMTLCWTWFSTDPSYDHMNPSQFLGPNVWVLLKCGAKYDENILCQN